VEHEARMRGMGNG